MQIERTRPLTLRVTLSVYEMATLMAAARWAVEGGEGELTPEARTQLRKVVVGYDQAFRTLSDAPAPELAAAG